LVHSENEVTDLSLLTVAAVEYRDTSGNEVERDLSKSRDVLDEVVSADVEPLSEVILCLVPYCKTIVSPDSLADLHVPDAAHLKTQIGNSWLIIFKIRKKSRMPKVLI